MKTLWNWFKKYWLLLVSLGLLAFIPLYPKFPLFDIVQTWVYIRLEDLIVAVAAGAVFINLLMTRQMKLMNTPLTVPILVFWFVGFVSLVYSLLFIGPNLAGYFPHLAFLHYARRIEYMIVFFIAFLAIKKHTDWLPAVIWTLVVTSLAIIIYGFGQKFLGFPAFLTMNEEFAKGTPLRLPPTARIPSTFAGHYDLSAYLVLTIPIFGSLVFGAKKWWGRIIFFGMAFFSLVLLLFTASRISFGVYLVAITTMLIWQKKKILIVPVLIASFVMLNFVSGASERFYKTFRFSDVIVDLSTGQPIGTLDSLEGSSARLKESESPAEEELPTGSSFIGVPATAPVATQPIETVEIFTSTALATGSGEVATVSGSFLIQKALVYDISITTRFQGQWPRAIEAFKRNVLLGSGYSTLSVAVDGNYHRLLGEVGILGAVAYLGILFYAMVIFLHGRSKLSPLPKAFVIGVFAGIVGLLFNAILIDVFEASKVAFVLWLLLGFVMALLAPTVGKRTYWSVMWNLVTHPIAFGIYLVLFTVLLYNRTLSMYFIGDDFTWLRWSAETTFPTLREYLTDASGFFLRPVPKLWFFALYAVFWLKAGAYHIISVGLFSAIVIGVHVFLRRLEISKLYAWIFPLLFASLAIHHENVIWVSGQSSLLGASGLMIALLSLQHIWIERRKFAFVFVGLAFVGLVISMGSYEGMIVSPVIVSLIGAFVYKKRALPAILLLLVPLYAWIRQQMGALPPGGDYAYNWAVLPANVAANVATYTAAMFFGPKSIEYAESVRAVMRQNKETLVWVLGGGLALLAAVAALVVKKYRSSGMVVFWLVVYMISLAPYLALGGVAERYGLVASVFFIVAMAVLADRVSLHKGNKRTKLLIVMVVTGVLIWNVRQLRRIHTDWETAGTIVETNLLTIRKNYFPLQSNMSFIFVNVPIRHGRAWVFPVGLEDAVWHMFRRNPFSFSVHKVATIEEAYTITTPPLHNAEVLLFEDHYLKKIIRTIEPVEGEEGGNESTQQ